MVRGEEGRKEGGGGGSGISGRRGGEIGKGEEERGGVYEARGGGSGGGGGGGAANSACQSVMQSLGQSLGCSSRRSLPVVLFFLRVTVMVTGRRRRRAQL